MAITKQLVSELHAAENKAKSLLTTAAAKKQQLVQEAQQKSLADYELFLESLEKEREEIIASARKELNKEKAKILAEYEKEASSIGDRSSRNLKKAVLFVRQKLTELYHV